MQRRRGTRGAPPPYPLRLAKPPPPGLSGRCGTALIARRQAGTVSRPSAWLFPSLRREPEAVVLRTWGHWAIGNTELLENARLRAWASSSMGSSGGLVGTLGAA
jgi:hypothetical protein